MKNYVVVIDPGHGSEEYPGGEFGPYVEKDIDLAVANVIKSRLEEYEGVEVVLTRYGDDNVGLKERCDIARANKADLFVSVHFNLSSAHNFYGSEVWIPVQKDYYNKTYPLANELMNNFEGMGLFSRGIKTRTNSAGNNNYYAVLKYCTDYGIPSVLVEHCHMDNTKDNWILPVGDKKAYENSLVRFGALDADAIAKYLHLKSRSLGVDYSQYTLAKSNVRNKLVVQDESPAEINTIELVDYDSALGKVTLNMHAEDNDSFILYYQYSFDGGVTFSELKEWPRISRNKSQKDLMVTLDSPRKTNLNIVTIVYNSFDKPTLSNLVSVNALSVSSKFDEYETSCNEKIYTGTIYENNVYKPFLHNCGIFSGIFLIISLGILLAAFIKRKIKNDAT